MLLKPLILVVYPGEGNMIRFMFAGLAFFDDGQIISVRNLEEIEAKVVEIDEDDDDPNIDKIVLGQSGARVPRKIALRSR
jgi:hypothetical protein